MEVFNIPCSCGYIYIKVFNCSSFSYTSYKVKCTVLRNLHATRNEPIICIIPIIELVYNSLCRLVVYPSRSITIVVDNLPAVKFTVCPRTEVTDKWCFHELALCYYRNRSTINNRIVCHDHVSAYIVETSRFKVADLSVYLVGNRNSYMIAVFCRLFIKCPAESHFLYILKLLDNCCINAYICITDIGRNLCAYY